MRPRCRRPKITSMLECVTGSCGRMPSIRSCRAGESTRNSATLLFLLQIAAAPGSTYHPRVNCGLIPSDVFESAIPRIGLICRFPHAAAACSIHPVTYRAETVCNDRCARFHGERVCEDSERYPRHELRRRPHRHSPTHERSQTDSDRMCECGHQQQRRRVIVWNRLEYRVHVKIRI